MHRYSAAQSAAWWATFNGSVTPSAGPPSARAVVYEDFARPGAALARILEVVGEPTALPFLQGQHGDAEAEPHRVRQSDAVPGR
jgi:hypothetical protein